MVCSTYRTLLSQRNFARRHTHGLSIAQIISSTETSDDASMQEPYGTTVRHPPAAPFSKVRKVIHEDSKLEDSELPNVVSSSTSAMGGSSSANATIGKVPGEINFGQRGGAVNNIIINTSYSSVNTNVNSGSSSKVSSKRSLDQRMNVQVTEDELDWLYLFRQKPGADESKEAWLKRVEQVAGFSLRPKKAARHDDDELSEIDAADAEDLANFDGSNMEDLFE